MTDSDKAIKRILVKADLLGACRDFKDAQVGHAPPPESSSAHLLSKMRRRPGAPAPRRAVLDNA